jgi:hypothetical protein
MLAVLDAATVARLQALVAMAAPAAVPAAVPAAAAAVSEPQSLILEAAGAAEVKEKVKKTLSPEHKAKMKAVPQSALKKVGHGVRSSVDLSTPSTASGLPPDGLSNLSYIIIQVISKNPYIPKNQTLHKILSIL